MMAALFEMGYLNAGAFCVFKSDKKYKLSVRVDRLVLKDEQSRSAWYIM